MPPKKRSPKATASEKEDLRKFLSYVEEVKNLSDRAIANIPSYTLAVEPGLMDTLIDVLRFPQRYV